MRNRFSIPLLATYLGMLAWDYQRQRNAAMAQMQRSALERAQNATGHIDARLAAVQQLAFSSLTTRDSEASPPSQCVLGWLQR